MNNQQDVASSGSVPAVSASDHSPPVSELIADFKRCSPWSGPAWNRVQTNDDTRFCRWAGQSADGRKHGQDAFPWENASDCRVPLADGIVNDEVALCCVAFWRAMLRPKAAEDEAGTYAVKLVEHFVDDVMGDDLAREVELSAQHRSGLGWVALHPTWEKVVALENRPVAMDDLMALAQRQPPDSPVHLLPMLVMDPTAEDQAIEILQQVYRMYAAQEIEAAAGIEVPDLKSGTLRRAVRELRTKGKTEVPIPYLCKNQPAIFARKPWDEVFLSANTTDLSKGGVIFERVWMSEAAVRANVLTEEWDAKWVEQAVKQKGKFSTWATNGTTQSPPTSLSAAMTGTTPDFWQQTDTKDGLIEVIYACYVQVDGDGVVGVYYCVFQPAVADLYAASGLVPEARGEMPYVVGARETTDRRLTMSRAVPEIAATWQRQKKVLHDGVTDWTSMGTLPPILKEAGAVGTKFVFAPGQQNVIKAGREPKFMEVPGAGVPISLEMATVVNAEVDDYFGRDTERVSPTKRQSKQQMLINSFLLMWSKALSKMLNLCRLYMDDAEFADITGAPVGWLEVNRKERRKFSAQLHFDARELDPEYMKELMQTVDSVAGADRTGVMNATEVTKWKMQVINPKLAKRFITDEAPASQRMFDGVKNDLVGMFAGSGTTPKDMSNDPTAPTLLKNFQQILGNNPKMMGTLPPELVLEILGPQAQPMVMQMVQSNPQAQVDPLFTKLVQDYYKNLKLGSDQQDNKVTGRIGFNQNR